MPARRRRRGRIRRLAAVLGVLVVLGAAAYAGWRLFGGSGSTPTASTKHCHTPTAAVAPDRPAAVKVRVLNTTLRTGLAAQVRRELKARGFRVVGIGNASPRVTGVVIRYPRAGTSGQAEARAVAEQLPTAHLQQASGHGVLVIEIGRGFTGLASPHAVAAARQADEKSAHPRPVCTRT